MKEFNNNEKASQARYPKLSEKEREEIALGCAASKSIRQIARELCRAPSTISREICRNKDVDAIYRALEAQKKFLRRLAKAHECQGLKNPKLRRFVTKMLIDDEYTPEQIAGKLRILYPDDKNLQTNYESIYKWIRKHRPWYAKYLPKAKEKPKKRVKKSKTHIPNATSIDEREEIVNERARRGDYEVDLIVSKGGKAVLLTAVDRKTRLLRVVKMRDAKALTTHKALVKMFHGVKVHTITYDNGLENAMHEETNRILGCKSYFCKPYHSWEKGSIENRNRAIRKFFPKGTNFNSVTQEQVNKAVHFINSRPMKCLGWFTPYEAYGLTNVAI